MFNDAKYGLTAERLKEMVLYDPRTGVFRWLEAAISRNTPHRVFGGIAGELKPSGYVLISIDGHRYRAHRLAWLYVKGVWPTGGLDHRDLNRSHNAFHNLRPASQQQNSFNTPVSKNSSCGFKGVYLYRGRPGYSGPLRWRAKINVGPRQIHLGTFDTPEEANRAYENAAKVYAGEFARAA